MGKKYVEPKFQSDDFILFEGDSFDILKIMEANSVDMIFADPPYFLSNGGITCKSGKMSSVDKGAWDETKTVEDKMKYNRQWIKLCRSVLKDDGTIWISGTLHNIYTVGVALELEGFDIINNIIWQKTNPPPNLACRSFTHSTETIIWARKKLAKNKKGKHYFDYKLMKEINNNKQMKDVWQYSTTPPREKKQGKHPTQKPLELLERIILSSTKKGDTILDPFNGSGTTGIQANMLKRKYIGIENNEDFVTLTLNRLKEIEDKINES